MRRREGDLQECLDRIEAVGGPGRRGTRAVMQAVRVPPSACNTSQSTVMVYSPAAFKSTTLRKQRPIKREISTLRPLRLCDADSRELRVRVAAGNIAYSAVSHALFEHPLTLVSEACVSNS